jgi:hypothetical protein
LAGKTQVERDLEALKEALQTLSGRINANGEALSSLAKTQRDNDSYIHESRLNIVTLSGRLESMGTWRAELDALANLKTDVAVLKRDCEELRKSKDEWGRRIWSLVVPLVTLVLGSVFGSLGTYLLQKPGNAIPPPPQTLARPAADQVPLK